MFSTPINTLEERAAFIALLAGRSGSSSLDPAPDPSLAHQPNGGAYAARVRGRQVVSLRALSSAPAAREPDIVSLDIAALAAAFAARLCETDSVAFTNAQSMEYARALQADMPRSRRALYCMTREIFVTTQQQVATFNRVFAEVFGSQGGTDRYRNLQSVPTAVAGMH